MSFFRSLFLCVHFLGVAFSQYFPPPQQNVTVVKSKLRKDVSISFKEPELCETTPGVKSYAGYVNLPPGTLSDVNQNQFYAIHQFFWFFESRKDPENAPLAIWLSGGTGYSALSATFGRNGPCTVNIDSNSTTLNPWSWNNEVNMLYIDQPNQVGFSYDKIATGILDLSQLTYTSLDPDKDVPQQNDTILVGKFPSLDQDATANTTTNEARALWLFAQVWFQEFPAYKPKSDKISIFTESFGGRLGPSFGAFIEEQNERIKNNTIPNASAAHVINLDTLGIVNGCVDLISQELSYPEMAFNNTYGIQAINKSQYEDAIDNFHRPQTGCLALVLKCQSLANKFDPGAYGHDEEVNAACAEASDYCAIQVESQYDLSGRSMFDIAASWTTPYSPSYFFGFLSQPWVQAALGVPVNFTQLSQATSDAFDWTGAYARKDRRRGPIGDIGDLLDKGVKVALLYGDRDYSCNWLGGENVSLAVNYSQTAAFRSAGYEDIKVNSNYVGGQVRQHGNFSFSRVYQAGSAIAASQPETAFRIFQRAIFGLNIATGEISIEKPPSSSSSNYSSTGTPTASHAKQDIPAQPEPTCYVLDPTTCDNKAWAEVYYSTGVIHDHILLDEATAHLFPELSSAQGNQTTGKIGNEDDSFAGRRKKLDSENHLGDATPSSSSSEAEASAALPSSGTTRTVPLRGGGCFLSLFVLAGVGVGVLCCVAAWM